jgi:hypothetical protein
MFTETPKRNSIFYSIPTPSALIWRLALVLDKMLLSCEKGENLFSTFKMLNKNWYIFIYIYIYIYIWSNRKLYILEWEENTRVDEYKRFAIYKVMTTCYPAWSYIITYKHMNMWNMPLFSTKELHVYHLIWSIYHSGRLQMLADLLINPQPFLDIFKNRFVQ